MNTTNNFIHLHVHSSYSFLDGHTTTLEIIDIVEG